MPDSHVYKPLYTVCLGHTNTVFKVGLINEYGDLFICLFHTNAGLFLGLELTLIRDISKFMDLLPGLIHMSTELTIECIHMFIDCH
jgi:hypothetical protein